MTKLVLYIYKHTCTHKCHLSIFLEGGANGKIGILILINIQKFFLLHSQLSDVCYNKNSFYFLKASINHHLKTFKGGISDVACSLKFVFNISYHIKVVIV